MRCIHIILGYVISRGELLFVLVLHSCRAMDQTYRHTDPDWVQKGILYVCVCLPIHACLYSSVSSHFFSPSFHSFYSSSVAFLSVLFTALHKVWLFFLSLYFSVDVDDENCHNSICNFFSLCCWTFRIDKTHSRISDCLNIMNPKTS